MKFILLSYFLIIILTVSQSYKSKKQSIEDGSVVYNDFCIRCHLGNGEGTPGDIPPLAKSDYLFDDIDRSIHAIKYGLSGKITVNSKEYDGVMEYQGLDNTEIADVMNYILNTWGNSYDVLITNKKVDEIKK